MVEPPQLVEFPACRPRPTWHAIRYRLKMGASHWLAKPPASLVSQPSPAISPGVLPVVFNIGRRHNKSKVGLKTMPVRLTQT